VAGIVLNGVGKTYPDGTEAVVDLDLEINDGELVVLVGPSGCGKTTALRMVAGLEEITRGAISLGGEVVNDLHPGNRDIAMVFQNYALYPHMTVRENIGFPLKLARVPRRKREARVAEVARMLGLEQHLMRRPRHLSGGQRQRVAMGRALIREPQAFLMDEPLSNLDAKLRVQMRAEIANIQKELAVTTLYVTHDQVEAMTMGDRVAVMRRARLQQAGVPQEIYDRPANVFVAGFVGSPQMNLVEAPLSRSADGSLVITLGVQSLAVDDEEVARHPPLVDRVGRDVIVGVRPEKLHDGSAGGLRDRRQLAGVVSAREALGSDLLVYFTVEGIHKLSAAATALAHDIEDPTEVEALALERSGAVLVARLEPHSPVVTGGPVVVAVAPGSLLFFDPADGGALRST
jgi:multiple sugar transport system ATP-binding protein